ncbi:AAA-like domain-containing protein, partial [bacterium]|nr:AAA-like domain-containing protein [bacterium]
MKNLSGSLSKPKRNFCAGGPIPKEGYYVLRDRPEISEIIDKVEKGRYFVIYAPRQVGKTSLIQEVVQKLSDDSEYLPLYLTFQNFDQKINKEDFYRELARTLLFEIQISLKNKNVENLIEVDESEIYSQLSFTKFMETLHGQIPHHLCLFIDEFEDIPKDVLDGFLRTLRGIYLKKQRDENYNILHSMGVIGVRSISQMTFARTSSPFNIHESISISNFTTEQVKELLMQYSKETGEVFSEEVIEFIADKTGGQPYLVNLVAKILTTEIKPYTENRPITIPNTENAYMKMLTMRGNSNLDSIRKRIRDANNRKRLMSIIT